MRGSFTRSIVSALLSGLVACSWGAIALEFESKAERRTWIGPEAMEAVPAATSALEKTDKTELDDSAAGPDDWVWVYDVASGNLAGKPVSQAKPTWKVAATDFKWAGEASIKVTHNGQAASAATVILKMGEKNERRLLSPSDAGQVKLLRVPFGPIQVTIEAKADGKAIEPVTQVFNLEKTRTTPSPTFEMAIAAPIDTIAAAQKAPEKDAAAKEEKAASGDGGGGNPVGQAFLYLLILVLAGVAGWYVVQFVKKNPDRVNAALSKAGVQIPTDPDPDALAGDDPTPSVPKKPDPPAQILLTDAAPAIQLGTPAPLGQPVLRADDGTMISIPDGTNVVSREPGSPFSFPNEPSVSRMHAEIVRDETGLLVRDLGSTNGTFVNGQRVQSDVRLQSGDTVQFGQVRLRVEG